MLTTHHEIRINIAFLFDKAELFCQLHPTYKRKTDSAAFIIVFNHFFIRVCCKS